MTTQYTYCPHCATRLEEQFRFDQMRLACPACHFVHFHDPKVAVIARVTRGREVLLVQRAVQPGLGQWSLPGGYMDAHEMPQAALQREMREEVGMAVTVGRLLGIFPMHGDAGQPVGIVLAFAAVPIDPAQPVCAQDDVAAADWFTPDNLPAQLAFASTRVLLNEWEPGRPGTASKLC